MSLGCKNLTIGVNGRTLVQSLNLNLEAGAFVGILGPNGVGKTLTLHTLAGIRDFDDGEIQLHGFSINNLDRLSIAKRLGLLLQNHEDAFPTTVLETALMGRHPHLGFWQWESPTDMDIAWQALTDMDLNDLTRRLTSTLSGGERRRLALSALLVQDPDIMLLDEPMNHLDPLHKLKVLRKLSALADDGKTIMLSLHDPTIAARFTRQVLLLHGDGQWEFGATKDMLTPAHLERLYGTPFAEYINDQQSVFLPTL